MPKKILMITSLFFLLILTACNEETSAVEKLKEEYPRDIKKVAEAFPKDVQKELEAPTKFPFKSKNADLTFASEPAGDPKGKIIMTEFIFGNGVDSVLHASTYHNKNTSFDSDGKKPKTVKLKDGTKATIVNNSKTSKVIRWKKDGLYHSIMLIKSPKSKKKYSIKDIVKTADSMHH
ncbi:hypothetical protein [Fictibacillus sp. FJAT-27399]|uniref:hypothetical protein n=1 Tax=Fictibacillus sp. FJAT-27399 TaxID=1729689 RepID=UPI0007802EC7|nr:hypothetical protein [Fictibacillus sp. FJAT-27399]